MTDQPDYRAHCEQMRVPGQIACVTQQRDEALSRLGEVLHQRDALARELESARMTMSTLGRINSELHEQLERMELAEASRLAADQQHANEPDDVFADADPAPATTTGHVMPARALGPDKQAIGLFW